MAAMRQITLECTHFAGLDRKRSRSVVLIEELWEERVDKALGLLQPSREMTLLAD